MERATQLSLRVCEIERKKYDWSLVHIALSLCFIFIIYFNYVLFNYGMTVSNYKVRKDSSNKIVSSDGIN